MTSKEALEIIGEHCNEYDTARNRYQYEYSLIEKDLEVLDIIKDNEVDIWAIRYCTSLEQYNCKEDGRLNLNEYEYNLLKEWIKDESIRKII